MAQTNKLEATVRPQGGKGAARAVRREGKVPAVIYGGDEKTPQTVALDHNELFKIIKRGRFLSTVFDIEISGKSTRAIPRDVQLDPVKDVPIHVDFQRIGADNRVRIGVPMRFINEANSPGLKRGGVLNIVRREVEVWAPADKIPEYFEANLEGLEIGRSVHISAIKLPDGVRPTITDRDFTIATIAGAVKQDVDEAVPGATPVEGAAPAEGAPAAAGGDAKAAAGGAKGAAPAAAAAGKAPAAAAAKAPAGGDKGKK
ncbi:MAG TPA: 50S ribosomal protein L25/general stress protein Ctc [Hyphomicrobiaceae bacterium]